MNQHPGIVSRKNVMLEFKELKEGVRIALLQEGSDPIRKVQEIVDILGDSFYNQCTGIIIPGHLLGEDFFDLTTGMAGEILQKFSNYRMKLAITGDFANPGSRSLRDFIRESNRVGSVNFVASLEEALKVLS